MRIGMIVDIYKPHVSGVINYVYLSKRFLEKAGHTVYIFTFGEENYPDEEPNVILSPGIPVVNTGFYLSLNYKKQARLLLYTMDVVHVHHPFLGGPLAIRYCRPRGIPIVFTNHTRYDLLAHAYLPAVPDVVSDSVLSAYLPPFCRSCDLVIAPSEGVRQVMSHLGVDAPIEVIPNGVDLAPFEQPSLVKERHEFGFTPAQVLLIYVGRLGPEKNLPFLLRSFAGVAQALENIRLMLVGDGSERDNLEDQARNLGIASKVIFTGMVPYAELPGYLAMADVFTTASVSEVHPLSVIEAMAAGLPVLGITSPGIADTINDGISGLLANHDLASFTAKMMRMVSEPELRKVLGTGAKEAVRIYDIRRTTSIMEEKYLLTRRHASRRKYSFRARLTRFWDRWLP